MDRQTIAIHEAGHAVAAVRLEIDYGRATIVPDEDAGYLGQVSCDESCFNLEHDDGIGCVGVENSELVENQIILSLAGYAALIAAGFTEEESMNGTAKDISDAEALLEKMPSLPLEHWKAKAVSLMSHTENINAVQRVANQLLKDHYLARDMIDVLVEVADGISTEEDYERFVRMHPSGPTGCRPIQSGASDSSFEQES